MPRLKWIASAHPDGKIAVNKLLLSLDPVSQLNIMIIYDNPHQLPNTSGKVCAKISWLQTGKLQEHHHSSPSSAIATPLTLSYKFQLPFIYPSPHKSQFTGCKPCTVCINFDVRYKKFRQSFLEVSKLDFRNAARMPKDHRQARRDRCVLECIGQPERENASCKIPETTTLLCWNQYTERRNWVREFWRMDCCQTLAFYRQTQMFNGCNEIHRWISSRVRHNSKLSFQSLCGNYGTCQAPGPYSCCRHLSWSVFSMAVYAADYIATKWIHLV